MTNEKILLQGEGLTLTNKRLLYKKLFNSCELPLEDIINYEYIKSDRGNTTVFIKSIFGIDKSFLLSLGDIFALSLVDALSQILGKLNNKAHTETGKKALIKKINDEAEGYDEFFEDTIIDVLEKRIKKNISAISSSSKLNDIFAERTKKDITDFIVSFEKILHSKLKDDKYFAFFRNNNKEDFHYRLYYLNGIKARTISRDQHLGSYITTSYLNGIERLNLTKNNGEIKISLFSLPIDKQQYITTQFKVEMYLKSVHPKVIFDRIVLHNDSGKLEIEKEYTFNDKDNNSIQARPIGKSGRKAKRK